MAIIIPPSIIKEYYHKVKLEADEPSEKISSPGEEAHIYNLYEELSMPISDIIEIGRLALEGKLENVQEKMDGQFLAFTVVDGQLKFFTKMDLQSQSAKEKRLDAIRSKSKGGGMNLEEIMSTYTGSRSNIAEGFAIAYKALEPVAVPYQDALFRNGEVVIASQIMVSKNPNTILYDKDSLRTVKAISLTEDDVDGEALRSFESEMKLASTDAFTMDKVPTAKLMKGLEIDDAEIKNLEKDLEKVVSDAGLDSKSTTVGDYVKARVETFLEEKYDFIPSDLISDVADRFVTGKGKVALRLKKKVTPENYQIFRDLDKAKTRIVQEAIIPLEEIIQRLGVMIIDKLDLALTAGNHEDLLGFIRDAQSSFSQGKILGDPKTLEGIRVALARMDANQDLLSRATEGIVFTYNNKTYKLTGLFTPVNRLRGFFGKAMGREGFGKATLPDNASDEKDIDEMLSEIIQHTMKNTVAEGGNAFRPRDKRGRPTGPPVTTDERISRQIANKITSEVEKNVLQPLGLDYLPVGSTATNKKEIGDVDLVVSEPDLSVLHAGLISLPYLRTELVPGIARVMELPGGQAITIMIDLGGKYYQVDLFKSRSIEDTAWELSGGGEGEVKGEYHKLMLSLLAKIKGERESSPDKVVKYTIAFPGGWREKIGGKENLEGRIIDPDNYLPLIGIDVPKDTVRTFNQLVDYMLESSIDEFREALGRFESYIGNRLGSKSESVRNAAQEAMEYINTASSQRRSPMPENVLRKAIRDFLLEQEEDVSVDIEIGKDTLISPEAESPSADTTEFNSAKTWASKTRAIQKILSSGEFLGSDFEKSIGGKASIGLMRFGLKSGSSEKHDFSLMMNKLYDLLSPNHSGSIKELAPNEGNNPSSSYIAYHLPDTGLMILFGIAGVTGGQRKAGYEYEIGVRDSLESSGIEAAEGSDNSLSDIYVPTAGIDKAGQAETLGIEVKLPNAQAGEPTLAYDFDQGIFVATNPKPQNKDIANLINADPSRIEVGKRLKLVMDAINAERRKYDKPEIESLLRKISRDEYVNIAQPVLNDNPIKIGDREIKGALLAVYKISAEILRKYYMLKKAGLVQIKGKGLFHLDPEYKISITAERETQLFEFPDAYGAVYFRNFRGGNYGIRSQLTNSPLKKLPVSGIDLDKEADRKDFISVVKKSTFPNPKLVVNSAETAKENEPVSEESISEALRKMIRSIL